MQRVVSTVIVRRGLVRSSVCALAAVRALPLMLNAKQWHNEKELICLLEKIELPDRDPVGMGVGTLKS